MKKKNSGTFKTVLGILVIMCLIKSCTSSLVKDNDSSSTSNKQNTEAVTIEETETEEGKELSDYFDEDMCNEIMNLLENDLGFDGIRFCYKDDLLENYYFNIDDYYITVTAYADDGVYNVYAKDHMDYMFYDIDEGIEMTYAEFKDKTITASERTYYYLMAKEAVKSVLVSPSSAKFASESEMAYGKKGDIVAVQGTVTAKNQLGVKIESNFTIEIQVYDMETYSYGVLYLKLDDETSGEWVDID
jgi:hypothetical protein